VDHGSIFDLDPAAAHWLAKTFGVESPQRALLDSLALAAEAEAARRGMRGAAPTHESRPLLDLLSEDRVGKSVRSVEAVFPDLPIPREPGQSQLHAIDKFIRHGR
jgi:hypothetical protein